MLTAKVERPQVPWRLAGMVLGEKPVATVRMIFPFFVAVMSRCVRVALTVPAHMPFFTEPVTCVFPRSFPAWTLAMITLHCEVAFAGNTFSSGQVWWPKSMLIKQKVSLNTGVSF